MMPRAVSFEVGLTVMAGCQLKCPLMSDTTGRLRRSTSLCRPLVYMSAVVFPLWCNRKEEYEDKQIDMLSVPSGGILQYYQ